MLAPLDLLLLGWTMDMVPYRAAGSKNLPPITISTPYLATSGRMASVRVDSAALDAAYTASVGRGHSVQPLARRKN